jgi:mRNA interferase RelE/StbE
LPAAERDRLRRFFDDRLLELDDPRSLGGPLHGSLAGLWKYRVGDIRVIAQIKDERLIILVVQIGNRREIFARMLRQPEAAALVPADAP